MTDFFDKLKKGMDADSPIEEPTEELIGEPVIELTSIKTDEPEVIEKKPKRKKKAKSKKKEPAIKEKVEIREEVEEPKFKDELEDKEIEDNLFEGPEGELTVDVFQKGNDLIVRSAIAGVDPEDLDIMIEDDLLIIKGKREGRFAEENENYFFQECYWGRFKREIILPLEVDNSKVSAKFKKGILTIKIPIIEREPKTKVSVE